MVQQSPYKTLHFARDLALEHAEERPRSAESTSQIIGLAAVHEAVAAAQDVHRTAPHRGGWRLLPGPHVLRAAPAALTHPQHPTSAAAATLHCN